DYARRAAQAADEFGRKGPAAPTAPAADTATPPGTTSAPPGDNRATPSPATSASTTRGGPATPGVRPSSGAPLPPLELTPSPAAGLPTAGLVTKVYPVDGLAADEKQAESLVRVIQRAVAPDSWDVRGGPGMADYFAVGK